VDSGKILPGRGFSGHDPNPYTPVILGENTGSETKKTRNTWRIFSNRPVILGGIDQATPVILGGKGHQKPVILGGKKRSYP
jgi:hypothetical protein